MEPYWAIVIQEPRETADRSKGIEEGWMKPHPRFPARQARLRSKSYKEMPIKVLPKIRQDVDLWCDPYLTQVLFFSDRLKRALDEVPGVEHFHLMPVVGNQ
ncbi:hypothetical protein OCA8868_00714 [Octadecabacter ascidiaceicola]|uniref:Uncharacterized protein n=1 Tax=Octadecabacter ascidiaceicola TaxID=1655543 RepID=A0A238JNX6_9RHOB|nr:hypothetical protein OCA8868_00714 [Octadecabacter ascidiaceicola]